MQEREQIFSSTGELGLQRRAFDRLYWNWRGAPIQKASIAERAFEKLKKLGETDGRSRVVFRAILGDEAFKGLSVSLVESTEVAVHLGKDWLIFIADNKTERTAIMPLEDMVLETSRYLNSPRKALERLQQKESEGLRFISTFDEQQIGQVYALWEKTFGWSFQEVRNLQHKLEQESNRPDHSTVWFAAAAKGDELLAASMAEKIRFKTDQGFIDLVENTEWKTKEGFENQGLITATISSLNLQIVESLGNSPYLIFAECNFMSRSDRAATGAGFVVPERQHGLNHFPQVLVQNVAVNDGFEPAGLRDFTFMYLPHESIHKYYLAGELK